MKTPPSLTIIGERNGVTLVELLISMAIISVGMAGVIGLFPIAHQHLRAGGEQSKATGLAQAMLEILRDEPLARLPRFHNADTRHTSSFPIDDPGETPSFYGGSALVHWRTQVASLLAGGGPDQAWGRIEVSTIERGLLTITVTVGWPATPAVRTVQLTTHVATR